MTVSPMARQLGQMIGSQTPLQQQPQQPPASLAAALPLAEKVSQIQTLAQGMDAQSLDAVIGSLQLLRAASGGGGGGGGGGSPGSVAGVAIGLASRSPATSPRAANSST